MPGPFRTAPYNIHSARASRQGSLRLTGGRGGAGRRPTSPSSSSSSMKSSPGGAGFVTSRSIRPLPHTRASTRSGPPGGAQAPMEPRAARRPAVETKRARPKTSPPCWSGWRDLNPRPLDPQSSALTKLRHSPDGFPNTLYHTTSPVILQLRSPEATPPCAVRPVRPPAVRARRRRARHAPPRRSRRP